MFQQNRGIDKPIKGKDTNPARVKNDPTQFVVLQKKKKTIEQLKEQDIPKFMEKEELALILETAAT